MCCLTATGHSFLNYFTFTCTCRKLVIKISSQIGHEYFSYNSVLLNEVKADHLQLIIHDEMA